MEALSNIILCQQVENTFDLEDNLVEGVCHDFCCDICTRGDLYMDTTDVTKDLENHIFCCDENTFKVLRLMNTVIKETSVQTSTSSLIDHASAADMMSVRSGHHTEMRETSAQTSTSSFIDHATALDVISVRSGHQTDDASENHFQIVAKAVYKKARKKKKKKPAKLMQKGNCRHSSRYADSFQELSSYRGFDLEIGSTLSCPVCLELYFRPHLCHPCQHVFCEPCLRRMTSKSAESVPCPLCRNIIQSCSHDKDLDQRLKIDYPDIYQERAKIEKFCKSRYNQLPLMNPLPLSHRFLQSMIQYHQARRYIQNWLHVWIISSLAYVLPLGFGFSVSFLLFLYNDKLETGTQTECANTYCLVVEVMQF